MLQLKHIICLLPLIVALLASGCAKDADTGPVTEPPAAEISVGMSFLVPDAAEGVGTRLTGAQESAVTEVRVVWFDQSGNYVHNALGLELSANNNIYTCRFLMNAGTYDIMVLANSRQWFESAFPAGVPQNTTKDSFIGALIAECTGDVTWAEATIPMWGMKPGVVIDRTNDNVPGISLARALARIDITTDAAAAATFQLESATVYRTYRKGRLVPVLAADHWDNTAVKALKPSLATGADLVNNDGKTFTATSNAIENSIYVFETPKGEDLSTAVSDRNPCVVIRGKYNGGSSTYYRIDLTKNSSSSAEYIDLLRNNIYQITIKGIDRDGAPTPAEALNGRPANVTYDISEVSKSGMNNIAWNGQHYIMASADTLAYWNNASVQPLRIQTNHTSGWKVASKPSWVTVTPDNSSFTAESTADVAVSQNSSGVARTGQIVLMAGELELTVQVEQSDMEEFTLSVTPSSLLFYGGTTASPPPAQTVTISTVPSSMQYTITYQGDVVWSTTPTSPGTASTVTFRPSGNQSGVLRADMVTVTVTHPDGRVLREEINVRHYPENNPFTVQSPTGIYAAIAQADAKIRVQCAQDWYLKRSVPTGLASMSGIKTGSASAIEYDFSLLANNNYSSRDITLVFSTADDTVEYEYTITQSGVVPLLYFYNAQMNNVYDVEFTGSGAETHNVPMDVNFPWRFSETGLGTVVSTASHSPGVIYPVADISAGKQETLSFTSIDYTSRAGMPAAGTVINGLVEIYNENTSPYPTERKGVINIKHTIPPVFDVVSATPQADIIPRAGGVISLTAGSNDSWSINATGGLNTPAAAKGANYEVNTLTVNIAPTSEIRSANTYVPVELYYTFNGSNILVGTYKQEPHRISFRVQKGEFFDSEKAFYGLYDRVPVDIMGDFPQMYIRISCDNVALSQPVLIPAGIYHTHFFDIPENPLDDFRRIHFDYSVDGINWTSPMSREQYPAYYFHMGNFYSTLPATTGSSPTMTWAEAMGIDLQFNNATFYYTWENLNREPNEYPMPETTGCGAYNEDALPGDWQLATSLHIEEMLRAQAAGEFDFGITEGQKFHARRDGGMDMSRIYWLENGQIKYSEEAGNKSAAAHARCIRIKTLTDP